MIATAMQSFVKRQHRHTRGFWSRAVPFSVLAACAGGPETQEHDDEAVTPASAVGAAVARDQLTTSDSTLLATLARLTRVVRSDLRSGDWQRANLALDSMAVWLASHPTEGSTVQRSLAPLDTLLTSLRQSTFSRESHDGLRVANQLSLMVLPLLSGLRDKVPWQVHLLEVYGSELELAAERKDLLQLRTITVNLRDAWVVLQPQMARHDGIAERMAFDMPITKLASASTAGEFSSLAREVLRSADEIEALWTQ